MKTRLQKALDSYFGLTLIYKKATRLERVAFRKMNYIIPFDIDNVGRFSDFCKFFLCSAVFSGGIQIAMKGKAMAKKQSGDKPSSIASRVLRTGKATKKEAKTLAASVLSQDEIKGRRGK